MEDKFGQIHFNSKLLATEMEKRGINVTHIPNTRFLVATHAGHTETIDETDLSVMPKNLRTFLDDKWRTKKLLKSHKIPVAEGKAFKLGDTKKAGQYAEKLLAKPLHSAIVLKPMSGSHGYGIRMNIETIKEFKEILNSWEKNLEYRTDILVEEQIEGAEFRLTVTKNGFFAAVHRACPNITGDGTHTIFQLIAIENHARMNPRSNCLCEIWLGDGEVERYLTKKRLTLNYIPSEGEKIYLRANSNVSTGAKCIDVTGLVHPFYKKLAFKILKTFPGLPYCGIDLITKDISEHDAKTRYVICEINPAPGISLHTHPSTGEPKELPAALIDLIFPETAKKAGGAPSKNPNKNRYLKDPELSTLPKLNKYFQKKAPRKWFFRPSAIELELTNVCNLRCDGCAILDDVKNSFAGLSAAHFTDYLNQAYKIGVYAYSITGGEPFLKLNDVCEIIKNARPEIYKIQTNGSLFKNAQQTRDILLQLKKAGFATKNKYIAPSINISAGMQNTHGVPVENIVYLTHEFIPVFGTYAFLVLNILTYNENDEAELFEKLEKKYQEIYHEDYPFNAIIINRFKFEYTPALEKRGIVSGKEVTMDEIISGLKQPHFCLINKKFTADSPSPRTLIRADGSLFSCSCFGHVFSPGNLQNEKLKTLVAKINGNKSLRIIKNQGLQGLYRQIIKTHPEIAAKKIPESSFACQICRELLKENLQ